MSSLRVGVIGLGRVSGKILDVFALVDGVDLAGAADMRAAAREAFTARFHLPAYETAEALCASRDIDAVWVATPNPHHRDHVIAAARAGKHVICEKPMATTLAECDEMIAAADVARTQILMVSKILEAPIRAIRRIVDSGRIGAVFQINTMVFTDWLQRPRLADELRTELGGGILFRQAPHAVDIQRFIVGLPVSSVRAVTGRRDQNFATEGHFSALLAFENGVAGTMSLNGYGYFDGAELTYGVGESGQRRSLNVTRKVRPRRTSPMSDKEKYQMQTAVSAQSRDNAVSYAQPFYGLTVVSGDRGVIRQSETGLLVYDANGCEELSFPVDSRCAAELIELRDAIGAKRPVFPDGRWGRDTLNIANAMLRSSSEKREVLLSTPETTVAYLEKIHR